MNHLTWEKRLDQFEIKLFKDNIVSCINFKPSKQEVETEESLNELQDFLDKTEIFSIQQILETLKRKVLSTKEVQIAFDLALHDWYAKKKSFKLDHLIADLYRPEKFEFGFLESLKLKLIFKNLDSSFSNNLSTGLKKSLNNSLVFYPVNKEVSSYVKKIKELEIANLILDFENSLELNQFLKINFELEKNLKSSDKEIFILNPVKKETLSDLKTLQENTNFKICAYKALENTSSIKKVIENKICRAVVLDLNYWGGIYETTKVLKIAIENNLSIILLNKNNFFGKKYNQQVAYSLLKVFPEIKAVIT